ncbi:hypothetical protein Tco_1304399 [Tanacetum coccineum]
MIFLSFAYNLSRQSQGYAGNAGKNQASGARCTAKKRVKDSEWFKDKMLLAQAQEAGVVLNDEQHVFLADTLEETDCEDLQLQATSNFKEDRVDAYDSDCDNEATTNAIFMVNLSPVGSINDDTVEPRYDFDILSKNDMMLSVIEQMKSQVEKCNMVNQESQSVNESLTRELKRYKDRVRLLEYAGKDGCSEKEACKFDECIKRTTTLSPHQIGSCEQSDIKGAFKKDVIPFSENLKETFKLFEKGYLAEVKEMKDIFEQMKDEVDQCSVAKKCFEIEKKKILINKNRLLEENIASDIMCTYLRSLNEVDNCGKCKSLDIVILDL